MPDPTDVVGRRIAAGLVDVLLLVVLLVVVGVAFGQAKTSGTSANVTLHGGPALVYFALLLLYCFATEAAFGRTPGKALLGLRVVRADGAPAGLASVAVRTLLRLIDGLPVLYLLGVIVVIATGRHQRVGDLAGRTLVIRA